MRRQGGDEEIREVERAQAALRSSIAVTIELAQSADRMIAQAKASEEEQAPVLRPPSMG